MQCQASFSNLPTLHLPCTSYVTMPHILDLANEVLYQIIAAISPHDIESLAASCRTVKTLSEPKVKLHRELKNKYAKLECRHPGALGNAPGVHPIYVLRDVLHDKAVAQYPTFIRSPSFDNEEDEWLSIVGELGVIRAVAAGCQREIQNAIDQCPYIEIAERETWKEQIMKGRGEAIFGLLLTLLPHLTSTVVVQQPEGLFMQMFERIVQLRQPPHRHAQQALTKLARIDTAPYYSMNDVLPANQFDFLSQYALLPCMRTITGSRFQTGVGWHARTFRWRQNPGISAVTEIKIDRSTVDAKSITNLLQGVRALERFSFSLGGHQRPWPVYQPRKIINGLKQYAKGSLSYLHLTGARIGIISMQIDDLKYDLRMFETLKQLQVDQTLLSHHDRPCSAPSKQMRGHDCNCWPQRLVDVLPASLESLKLVGPVSQKRIRVFFAGFPELKAQRLPRLREIEMQGSAAAELRFVHLCKVVGVVLSQNGGKDNVCYQCS